MRVARCPVVRCMSKSARATLRTRSDELHAPTDSAAALYRHQGMKTRKRVTSSIVEGHVYSVPGFYQEFFFQRYN